MVAFTDGARAIESPDQVVGGCELLVHFEHERVGVKEFAIRTQAMDRCKLYGVALCLLGDAPYGVCRFGAVQATGSFDAMRLGRDRRTSCVDQVV